MCARGAEGGTSETDSRGQEGKMETEPARAGNRKIQRGSRRTQGDTHWAQQLWGLRVQWRMEARWSCQI